MNVALYFGSFNPVHNGHLIIANFLLQSENIDELWFVVSPQNPFKNEKQLLNANHRLNLLKIALEGETRLKASNIEFNLPKPSYTIETLFYLNEKYPDYTFSILLGSDGFSNIEKWKSAKLLIENYFFWVYERSGYEILEKKNCNYKILEAPQLLISSTLIRSMIAENKSIRYFVPDSVWDEIQFQNYYK